MKRNGKVVGVILWRAFQALVVLPAGIAGTALLAFSLAGESPTHYAVGEIFHQAEIAAHTAQVDTVFVTKCVMPTTASSESPPKPVCDETTPKADPDRKSVV